MSNSPEFVEDRDNEKLSEKGKFLKLLREDQAFFEEVERELEKIRKEKVEAKHKLWQEQRSITRNGILTDLDTRLKIDENKSYNGRDGEHVTIILGDKVLGEIVSDDNLRGMDDREFQDKVSSLYRRFLALEKLSIIVNPDAQKVMDDFRVSLEGSTLYLPGFQPMVMGQVKELD